VQRYFIVSALDDDDPRPVAWESVRYWVDALPVRHTDGSTLYASIPWSTRQAEPAGFSETSLHFQLATESGDLVYEDTLTPASRKSTATVGALQVLPTSEGEVRVLVGYGSRLFEYTLE